MGRMKRQQIQETESRRALWSLILKDHTLHIGFSPFWGAQENPNQPFTGKNAWKKTTSIALRLLFFCLFLDSPHCPEIPVTFLITRDMASPCWLAFLQNVDQMDG